LREAREEIIMLVVAAAVMGSREAREVREAGR